MDQNMGNTQQREPLPVYNTQQAPNYAPPAQTPAAPPANLTECVDSAFGKSLAATIMAWFPICSILAIIFGSKGLKLVAQAEQMALHYGISAGGKNIAAKVLGKIGKIAGIVMTCFWGLYFIIIIAAIAATF